jgi:hypothetical protein
MRSPCCLCVSVCLCIPPSTFECLKQTFWNFVCISLHLSTLNSGLHKSPTSICVSVCVSLPIVARQRLGKHVPAAKNTCNSRRIVGRFFFCAVHVVSKESRRLVLLRTSCLCICICYLFASCCKVEVECGPPVPEGCRPLILCITHVILFIFTVNTINIWSFENSWKFQCPGIARKKQKWISLKICTMLLLICKIVFTKMK